MTESLQAAPLHWGQGDTTFEIFVEPTCPFSVLAMSKLDELLQAVGEEHVTVKLRLYPQPWHLLSDTVTRCVAAASTLPDGRDSAWSVLQAVGKHREEFVCEQHCQGDNRNLSINDVIARIEKYSGVALIDAFANPDVTAIIKWHSKYGRQNGIHSTPTFMVNGVVDNSLGSGDDVANWANAIKNAVAY